MNFIWEGVKKRGEMGKIEEGKQKERQEKKMNDCKSFRKRRLDQQKEGERDLVESQSN